jgi:hypothetical protein
MKQGVLPYYPGKGSKPLASSTNQEYALITVPRSGKFPLRKVVSSIHSSKALFEALEGDSGVYLNSVSER